MASLNVATPAVGGAAAVGGAGTAELNVPAPSVAGGDVPAAALSWALQHEAIADAVDAAIAAETAAPALAERLTRTHSVGLGMTPESSAKHLLALQSDTAAGTTRLEREYAALYDAVRAARARLVAALSRREFTVGPSCPTAPELRSGRHLPAAGVASLLCIDAAAVGSACDAIVAGVMAAEAPAAVLMDVYDALDMTSTAAAARLRMLALGGAEAAGLTSPATLAEVAYATHFKGVRDFRQAVAAALAPTAPTKPSSGTAELSVEKRAWVSAACGVADLFWVACGGGAAAAGLVAGIPRPGPHTLRAPHLVPRRAVRRPAKARPGDGRQRHGLDRHARRHHQQPQQQGGV